MAIYPMNAALRLAIDTGGDIELGKPDADGGAQSVGVEMGGTVEPTLSSILDGFDDATINIASFLPIEDALRLHDVNKKWHDILTKYEETLFGNYLKRDFAEGPILSYIAKEKNLSRKNLYFAFRKRWSLPKQGNENTSVSIPRMCPANPPGTKPANRDDVDNGGEDDSCQVGENDDDISALVFIGRVWRGIGGKPHCGILMKWETEYYDERRRGKRERQKLVIDKDAQAKWRKEAGVTKKEEKQYRGGPEPDNIKAYEILNAEERDQNESWVQEFCNALTESHHLLLHVIDVERCQVISLMDKTKIGDNDSPVGFINIEGEDWLAEYGGGLPKLCYDDDILNMDYMMVYGTLSLSWDILCTDLHFNFSYLGQCYDHAPKSYVCSYLRAMMSATSSSGDSKVTTSICRSHLY